MYLLLGAPKGENPHFTYIYSCLQRLNEWALLRTAVINQRPIKSFIISSLGRIWCAGEKLTGRGNMLAGCSDSRGKSYMLMIVWRSSLGILMFVRRIVASAALHKRVNLSAAASHVVGILHTLMLKIKKHTHYQILKLAEKTMKTNASKILLRILRWNRNCIYAVFILQNAYMLQWLTESGERKIVKEICK